jgi:hypothetical protein
MTWELHLNKCIEALEWGLAEDSNNADLKKIKKDIIALHAR